MPFSESPRTFRAARDCLISNALFTKIENNARGGPDLIWATTSHLLKKETPLRMLYGLLQPIQLCLPKHHLDTPIWLYRYAQFVVELKKLNPDFFFNKRIADTIFEYLLRSELFGVEGVERTLDEQRTASEIYWTENPARPEESDLKASTYLALLPSQCGSFSTCVQGLVSLNPTNTSLKHFMIGAVRKLLNHLAKERRDILCFEDQMPESLKFYFKGVAAFAKVLEEDEKFYGAVETSKDGLPAVFRPALDLSCLIELDYERRLIIPLTCSHSTARCGWEMRRRNPS